MLELLNDTNSYILNQLLNKLSEQDKKYFSPHQFNLATIRLLTIQTGNYYYLYLKEDANYGYGMIRTFGKYPIPTIGYVIWGKYRGNGYGVDLVKELIEQADVLGFKALKAKVHRDNSKSISVLKKNGFIKIGVEQENVWYEHS